MEPAAFPAWGGFMVGEMGLLRVKVHLLASLYRVEPIAGVGKEMGS